MFGPITPMVRNLLIINVAVWVIPMMVNFPLSDMMALHNFNSIEFEPYQIFTHIFAHGNSRHLLFNMVPLVVFAPHLENYFSSQRFLSFYLFCGLGAGVLYAGINYLEVRNIEIAANAFLKDPTPSTFKHFIRLYSPDFKKLTIEGYKFVMEIYPSYPEDPTLTKQATNIVTDFLQMITKQTVRGASGAVFGILMGMGMLFPNAKVRLLLFPFFPIKMVYLAIGYGSLEIYNLFVDNPNSNIAHLAHVGGMIFAFLYIKWFHKKFA